MAHLTQTTMFDIPVEVLDKVVRDAGRVPEYWVGMSAPIRAFGDGGPGSKAEYTMSMLGTHWRVVRRTVEERRNADGSTDWRWELAGGLDGWMTCHHEPREGGTTATTEFEYALPGRVFGRLIDRLLIEKRVRRDFEESLENMKYVAEASAAKPIAKAA